LIVVGQDVNAILAQPHVDLHPLQLIGDAHRDRRPGVLGSLPRQSSVNHDLSRARRLDRLAEREYRVPAWSVRASLGLDFPARETAQRPQGESDKQTSGPQQS